MPDCRRHSPCDYRHDCRRDCRRHSQDKFQCVSRLVNVVCLSMYPIQKIRNMIERASERDPPITAIEVSRRSIANRHGSAASRREGRPRTARREREPHDVWPAMREGSATQGILWDKWELSEGCRQGGSHASVVRSRKTVRL